MSQPPPPTTLDELNLNQVNVNNFYGVGTCTAASAPCIQPGSSRFRRETITFTGGEGDDDAPNIHATEQRYGPVNLPTELVYEFDFLKVCRLYERPGFISKRFTDGEVLELHTHCAPF